MALAQALAQALRRTAKSEQRGTHDFRLPKFRGGQLTGVLYLFASINFRSMECAFRRKWLVKVIAQDDPNPGTEACDSQLVKHGTDRRLQSSCWFFTKESLVVMAALQ